MTGQMAARTLRSALGWSQADLARETRLSVRTIRRIERGEVLPLPTHQHSLISLVVQHIPDHTLATALPRHVIDPDRMRHYLHNPRATAGWRHWTHAKRGQFRRWRIWYQRVLADAQAGRVYLVYQYRQHARTPQQLLARALDAAPTWDT